jgi:hypothetical protein
MCPATIKYMRFLHVISYIGFIEQTFMTRRAAFQDGLSLPYFPGAVRNFAWTVDAVMEVPAISAVCFRHVAPTFEEAGGMKVAGMLGPLTGPHQPC